MKKLAIVTSLSLSLLGLISSNASANTPGELVGGDYKIANWSCTYAEGYNAYRYAFIAYPYYKSGLLTAAPEVRYPPKKHDGKDAIIVGYNGQLYSDTGINGSHCNAPIEKTVYVENHRPSATFSVRQENKWSGGTNRVTLTATAVDQAEDSGTGGNITSYEWKVDGVKKPSTTNKLVLYTQHGGNFNIELKVVDDGVKVFHDYDNRYINEGDKIFKLDYVLSKDIDLSAWNCDRRCVID